MTRTAYQVLRNGAKQLREHCAPVAIWRELDDMADRMESGINPFEPVPHVEKPLAVVVEDEAE